MLAKENNQRVVLITGATKGIGLATALKFAAHGDQCVLTFGWGSVEEETITRQFEEKGFPLPYLRQANVVDQADTEELLEEVAEKFGPVDVFVSNVSFANVVKGLEDYSEKGLLKSIEYSTWPMIEYPRQMERIMGRFPRYIIGLSSHGPDGFHCNYDFAAVTKSLSETFIKYLNYHFFNEEVIFNIVRTRPIITDSLLSTFGKDWEAFISKVDKPGTDVSPEEVANVILMLCSGLMDGMRGQTINADKGYSFSDGLQRMYVDREQIGLWEANA